MWKFSDEGRSLQSSPCLMGGKHEPDKTWAREDTFYCQKCGAIPRDSESYREMMEAPGGYRPHADRP